MKQVDIATTTTVINTSGTIDLINGVAIGTSYFNRVGRKILNQHIQISGFFALTGTTTTQTDLGRIIILYDAQPNGALPVSTDILLDQTAAGATTTNILSGHNYNNQDRFIILYDERYYLPNTVGVPSVEIDYNVEINIPIKLETQFKADTSAITDISTGSIILYTLGSATAGTEGWNLILKTRVMYNDL